MKIIMFMYVSKPIVLTMPGFKALGICSRKHSIALCFLRHMRYCVVKFIPYIRGGIEVLKCIVEVDVGVSEPVQISIGQFSLFPLDDFDLPQMAEDNSAFSKDFGQCGLINEIFEANLHSSEKVSNDFVPVCEYCDRSAPGMSHAAKMLSECYPTYLPIRLH